MVRFGNYELPHVLEAVIQQSRIEVERPMPSRNVAYREDQTTNGRTVNVNGEIRATTISEALFSIELLRRLSDDTARLFDIEDGMTVAFNAKMIDPGYVLSVGDWFNSGRCYVPYAVTFLEVA